MKPAAWSIAISASRPFDEVAATLNQGQSVRLRAEGGSMLPAIRPGATLHCDPVLPSAIRHGDVLLCRYNARLLVRRVVGIERAASAFILRGDRPGSGAERVEARDVLGRISGVEPPPRRRWLNLGWSRKLRRDNLKRE